MWAEIAGWIVGGDCWVDCARRLPGELRAGLMRKSHIFCAESFSVCRRKLIFWAGSDNLPVALVVDAQCCNSRSSLFFLLFFLHICFYNVDALPIEAWKLKTLGVRVRTGTDGKQHPGCHGNHFDDKKGIMGHMSDQSRVAWDPAISACNYKVAHLVFILIMCTILVKL